MSAIVVNNFRKKSFEHGFTRHAVTKEVVIGGLLFEESLGIAGGRGVVKMPISIIVRFIAPFRSRPPEQHDLPRPWRGAFGFHRC